MNKATLRPRLAKLLRRERNLLVKVTKVKPGDRVLAHRPDVKYRAEIGIQPPTPTTFPNGSRVILSRSVTGYGVTREAAITEAESHL